MDLAPGGAMNCHSAQLVRSFVHSVCVLAVLLASPAPALDAQEGAPRGVWAGHLRAGEHELGLRIRVDEDGQRARFTVPHFGWYDLLAEVEVCGDALELTLPVYSERMRLVLRREDAADPHVLRGTFRGWGTEGVAELARSNAPALAFTSHPFDFESEGHALDGTLLLPPGDGPFPAIVWTHGSGRITREDPIYRSLAVWLVEHGVAALLYDKRPPLPGATMEVLAQDALAGVRLLRDEPRIRRDLVGVGGMSQGGWIAPLAAARSDAVGFVAGFSAPGVSPAEQNLFNDANKLRKAGFGEDDVREAAARVQAVYSYLRTGADKAGVEALLEESRRLPWYRASLELQAWNRGALPPAPWRYVDQLDLDPGASWRAIDVPVVCAWGASDDVVPPRRSAERIEGWLAQSGDARRLLTALPGASHDLRLPPREPWSLGAFPADANAVTRFVRSLAEERDVPPATRQGDDAYKLHGVTVPDPFRWLERSGSQAVVDWARAQDARFLAAFEQDPLAESFRARVLELNTYRHASVPRAAGGLWFTGGKAPGEVVSYVWVQSPAEHVGQLLLDEVSNLLIVITRAEVGRNDALVLKLILPCREVVHVHVPMFVDLVLAVLRSDECHFGD